MSRMLSMSFLRPLLAAALLLAGGAASAQQPSTWYADRPGAYLLFAGGGSQYELDCRSTYYYYDDCSYGRAGAGKLGLGFRFGNGLGVEGTWIDFGRAGIDNGRVPRDRLRMRALGVNAVFSLAFGPASEGLLRVGLVDVRHARTDDTAPQHIFTAAVGLAMLLHLGPHAALEIGWDATSGEGRDTGTAVASMLSAGLRWSF
ncbi:MAG: hypothetical protein IPM15_22380 [Betaproteobacteria bacterium]|nr:hypothetical protein [Betaproteobacteria bacterium]MCC6248169.1 hypothetical protein [Rubrivivax sp.]